MLFGFLTGIPAIICGHYSRRKISAASGAISGAGLALTGLILGYFGTILSSLIIGFVIFFLGGNVDHARPVRVQADLAALETQLMVYHALNGTYPTTEQGLQALIEKPTTPPIPRSWRRLMDTVLIDPWGNVYQYRARDIHTKSAYDLFSAGPDRQIDTADDMYRFRPEVKK